MKKCADIMIDESYATNARRRKKRGIGNGTEDIEIRDLRGPLHADRVDSLENVQRDRS